MLMNRLSGLAAPILTLALGLAAVPAAAQDPSSKEDCAPGAALFTPDPLGLPVLAVSAAANGVSVDGPTAQATCDATCCDGSKIYCWGSSCNADDANCPNQRGSCWGTDTGTRYCPSCTSSTCTSGCSSPCSATAWCNDGSQVSCNGCSGDCFAIDGCYAHCDGQYHLCPDATGPCAP